MRAITLRQPFADELMSGSKTIENRTWSTDYRGLVLIHTGQRYAAGGRELPHGVVLGVAELIDVHEASDSVEDTERGPVTHRCCRIGSGAETHAQFAASGIVTGVADRHGARLFHLAFEKPRRIAPIQWPGHEALWVPKPELLRRIARQLTV
jgi:hypothetical protein